MPPRTRLTHPAPPCYLCPIQVARSSSRRRRRRPLQLELRARTHGGRREGAGRPRIRKSRVAHRTREALASRFPVHVTMRVRRDVPSLRRGRVRRIVMAALVPACRRRGYRICHFSVQRDHIHLVCEARDAERLARGMQGLAVRIAKRINNALGRRGALWDGRYHSRVLRTPREVRSALIYVVNNGRHHAASDRAGPVPPECLDALSSAPYFDGWKERVLSAPAIGPPPVAAAGTWLLSAGWKRAGGRISVSEGPAG